MRRRQAARRALAALASVAILCLASACPLFMSPSPTLGEGEPPGYYSKTLTYYRYVDPAEACHEPVEVRIYDRAGLLAGIYRHSYAAPSGHPGDRVLSRSDFYAVSPQGNVSHAEYYLYGYRTRSYTDVVDGPKVDHLLERCDTFAPDGTKRSYYVITYLEPAGHPARYLTNRDFAYDEAGVPQEVARDECKYRLVGGRYHPVSEKTFVAPGIGKTLALSKETASWYAVAGGQARKSHDLYHTKRSDEKGTVEAWFYTRYDWDDAGRMFSRQDFDYQTFTIVNNNEVPIPRFTQQLFDVQVGEIIIKTINPWIAIPGVTNAASAATAISNYSLGGQGYPTINNDSDVPPNGLLLDYISDLRETQTMRYDDRGNVIEAVRSAKGSEFERVVYRYDGDRVLSMIRYMNGKGYAYDRTETRYYAETRDGLSYDVKEELAYRSYESDQDRGLPRSNQEKP